MTHLSIGACLACAALTLGCSPSRSVLPVAPSPNPPAAPAPPVAAVPQTLSGYVADTGFRPMAGVTVDVLSGPERGRQFTSDADGRFSSVGLFGGVLMRASKDGYGAATSTVIVSQTTPQAWAFFQMAPLEPPVSVAGSYTLTIAADSACTALPAEARTRSYAATVTVNSNNTNAPPNTSFNGTALDAEFAPYSNIFFVGVAGSYLAVSTEGEGPSIVERLGPRRYVAFTGAAGALVSTSTVTTISAPFKGSIEYCELKTEVGQYYDCSPNLAAVREVCSSNDSRLVLTRR